MKQTHKTKQNHMRHHKRVQKSNATLWFLAISGCFAPARMQAQNVSPNPSSPSQGEQQTITAQDKTPPAQGRTTAAKDQPPTPQDIKSQARNLPRYALLRQDEDYRYLRDPANRKDAWDPLKYIPLNKSGREYLSLSGEVRERYEYFNHPFFGQAPQDKGYLLQRYMFHADWHLNDRIRFFLQLKSGLVAGNEFAPHPPDEDDLDTHQLFGDFTLFRREDTSQKSKEELTFRVGRQELSFGSNRLITTREGPNVPQSFDGVRAWYTGSGWRTDLFTTRPVTTSRHLFDDGPDPRTAFWGAYAVGPLSVLPGGHVDLYYLGLDRDNAHFDKGAARETRHSVGTRLWGGRGAWDYNFEFVYQFGRFGPGAISAWTAASDTGYTVSNAGWKPRLGLKADIASGDQNPKGKNLNTFNPLFPSGKYFNEAGLGEPSNFIDVYPYLELHPSPRLTWSNGWDLLWRESLHDGFYSYSTTLLRSGQTSDARYYGSQLFTQVDWQVERHLSFSFTYVHFFTGDFIRESGPGKDVDYLSSWLTYKF